MEAAAEARTIVRRFLERTVEHYRRVFHTRKGSILYEHGGPLELEFDENELVRFEYSETHESMTLSTEQWEDPYDPMSIHAWDEICEIGRPQRFDLSSQRPQKEVIGSRLIGARELIYTYESVRFLGGFRLDFDTLQVDVYDSGGSTHVGIPSSDTFFGETNYVRGEKIET